MEIIYDRLAVDELRGSTQADYLIALDAKLQVIFDNRIAYEESGFPVVELARSLRIWLSGLESDRGDFEFDSMSIEDVGAIAFRQTPTGWSFSSTLATENPPIPCEWAHIEMGCSRLISRVEADLVDLGLDPREVLKG